jgi:hypothetical protein
MEVHLDAIGVKGARLLFFFWTLTPRTFRSYLCLGTKREKKTKEKSETAAPWNLFVFFCSPRAPKIFSHAMHLE